MEEVIQTNVIHLLSGINKKRTKCLDIVQLVLSSKYDSLKIDKTNIKNLFFKLFNICSQPELERQCLYCLSTILDRNNFLAYKAATQTFILYNCSIEIHEQSCSEFLEFLSVWIKIMKLTEKEDRRIMIDLGIVENYLKRLKIGYHFEVIN